MTIHRYTSATVPSSSNNKKEEEKFVDNLSVSLGNVVNKGFILRGRFPPWMFYSRFQKLVRTCICTSHFIPFTSIFSCPYHYEEYIKPEEKSDGITQAQKSEPTRPYDQAGYIYIYIYIYYPLTKRFTHKH